MLRAKTSWDGEIEAVVVEDTDGGVWHLSSDAQDEIQAASDKYAAAIEMCSKSPMRGTWSS